MRGEVPTIRPYVPTPRGDAEWFAQSAGRPRPTLRGANRQSAIRNHQSQAVYEYDVYGQVAASDPNHPNRFLFTGREFDTETGLYYYRARYYNPTIGRFLQTDPVGYGAGMNLYGYCSNNPIGLCDPSGCDPMDPNDVNYWKKQWAWQFKDTDGNVFRRTETFATADAFWSYLSWFGGGHIMPNEFLMENLFGTDSINNWDSSTEVTFEEVYYRGVKVIRVNGINLIDDSLLDSILQADDALSNSFHEANTTTPGSTRQGLMEWLYGFKTGFASDKREWLFYGGTEFVPIYEISPQFPGIPAVVGYEKQYVGGIYEGTEINYIIQGHAAARIGIPYAAVAAGVLAHNQIRPPDPGETVPLVPTNKLFWLGKGYNEYGKRRNW